LYLPHGYNRIDKYNAVREPMTDETEIIEKIRAGDTEAFRFLVERYQRPVISMIRNMLNDPNGCEDIAQDAFFAAFRKLRSFDPARSRFSTWLFTIARNKTLNLIRKKKPVLTDQLPTQTDCSDPSDTLTQKEFFDRLDNALHKLPQRQKRAFILAEFENLPYEDIAQIECTSLGTIKSRIHRAKKKLQKLLSELKDQFS
jgi:RNA polymerase sigma-70 factor (ECF subfamily)